MESLAQKLTKFREAKGLSQQELAEKSTVPQSSISRIEAGILKNPGWETLNKIAVALGIKITKLIG